MIPGQTQIQQQIQTINSLKYQIHDKNNGGGGGLGKEIKLHYLSKKYIQYLLMVPRLLRAPYKILHISQRQSQVKFNVCKHERR